MALTLSCHDVWWPDHLTSLSAYSRSNGWERIHVCPTSFQDFFQLLPAVIFISPLIVQELALNGWNHRGPSGYHSLWTLANNSSFVQPFRVYCDSYFPLLSEMCSLPLIWNWFTPKVHHPQKKTVSHLRTLRTDQNGDFFQIEGHPARNLELQSWAHTLISCGLLFGQLHLVVNFQSSHLSRDVRSAFAFIIQMDFFVQGKRCYGEIISLMVSDLFLLHRLSKSLLGIRAGPMARFQDRSRYYSDFLIASSQGLASVKSFLQWPTRLLLSGLLECDDSAGWEFTIVKMDLHPVSYCGKGSVIVDLSNLATSSI